MKEFVRQIKLFCFWMLLLRKVRKLKSRPLLRDVLACQEPDLLRTIKLYKFEGDTKQEQLKDCVALIKAYYNLKQHSENWTVPLIYELGGMATLNKKIRDYQPVVDLHNDLNNLLE